MNKHTQSVLRAGTLALALSLSSIAHAGVDSAKMKLDRNGSVPVAAVSTLVVGSSVQQAYDVLGEPSRRLSGGRWILFGDYCIDGSKAHGSLVVSFADGKVRSMEVVSHYQGIALCRASGQGQAVQVLAQN